YLPTDPVSLECDESGVRCVCLQKSGPMVGVPGQDCCGPVDLLEQHHADELVRPGRLGERQPQRALLPWFSGGPSAPPDQEHCRRPPALPPFAELGRKRAAVETLSAGIEHNHGCVLRNDGGERDRFFDHALAGIAGAAFPDFDDFDVAQTELTASLRGTLAIARTQFGFRALFQTPDRGHDDAPRAAQTISLTVARPCSPPPTSFPDCRRRVSLA